MSLIEGAIREIPTQIILQIRIFQFRDIVFQVRNKWVRIRRLVH